MPGVLSAGQHWFRGAPIHWPAPTQHEDKGCLTRAAILHVQPLFVAHNAAGFRRLRMSLLRGHVANRCWSSGKTVSWKAVAEGCFSHPQAVCRERTAQAAPSERCLLLAQQTLSFATVGVGFLHVVPVPQHRLPSLVSHRAAAHDKQRDGGVQLVSWGPSLACMPFQAAHEAIAAGPSLTQAAPLRAVTTRPAQLLTNSAADFADRVPSC